MPLLSEGHISAMTDGAPCVDAHGWLHHLQICKLLQHNNMVVCPEGLNHELEALQFTFLELPLWNAANPGKPAQKPHLIEVDLGSIQPDGMTTATQAPTTTPALPHLQPIPLSHHDITTAINLKLQGALEQLQWTSPTASAPVSQCSMPRREPPSVALGALPSTRETEYTLKPEGTSAIPAPMATLMQTSPQVATPGDTPSLLHVTYLLLQSIVPKTLEVASMYMFLQGCTSYPVR